MKVFVAWFALSLLADPAFAEPSKEAAVHVQRGRAAMAKKAWNDARRELAAAYELSPEPDTAYLAGRSAEELSSFAEAAEWYRRALQGGKLPVATAKDARARVDALEKRPVKVTIDSTPEGATVFVDGKEIAQKTPFFVHLAPGVHAIVVELASARVTREVTVAPLQSASIEVSLTEAHKPEAPKTEAPKTEEKTTAVATVTSTTTLSPMPLPVTWHVVPPARRAAWITAGAAVVALGFGAIYGVRTLEDHRRFDDHPTEERRSLGRRDALVTDLSLGLGLALGAVSGYLFWSSRAEETITVTPTLAGATMRVRF